MSEFVQSMVLLIVARIGLVCYMNMLSSSSKFVVFNRNMKDEQLKREDMSVFLGPIVEPVLLALMFSFGMLSVGSVTDLSLMTNLKVAGYTLLGWVFVIEPVYYWLHRILHIPSIMKHHHRVHHDSVVPRPVADFTFTVSERLTYTVLFGSLFLACNYFNVLTIQYIWFMVLLFDVINHIGHLNAEFYPSGYIKNKFLRNMIYSSSFHALHHSEYNYNYSLFMPIWDNIFGTTYDEEELFKNAKKGNPQDVKHEGA